MSSPWLRMRFSEAVEVNPRRTVKRGTITPFVDMATLSTRAPHVRPSRSKSAGAGGSRFRNGDTLFARITPCTENGKTGLVDGLATGEVGTGSTEFIVLGPRHRLTLARFVYYLAKNPAFRSFAISQMRGTSGRQRVPASVFDDYVVGVPSLPEQRKIAAILSSVDDATEKTQAVIDQVQVVKRGLMQDLFTRGLPGRHKRFKQTEIGEVPEAWDVVSLAQSGATVTSGSRGWAKYYSDDGALFLRITNVARNTIRLRLGDVRYVALPKGSTEGKRTRVQTGDLVISITADLGMVGFIPDGIGEAYVNQHLALVRLPDDALRPEFVGYFLATDIARNRFYRLNDASAKAGLNLPAIMKLTVPKPPRDEQDMTVEVLTATEDRLAVEEKKLVGLAAVKSALMSVLLTGELRVAPDPEPE